MATGRHAPDVVDPRIERSRLLVRRATLAEFGERGWGGLTIEGVAARAGVARSTVYRHWPDKLTLLTDALEALNEQPVPAADGETPRARVHILLEHLVTALADPAISSCVRALVQAAGHSPEVRDFHLRYTTERRRALTDAIAAGVESGEFPAVDPDLAAQSLSGAVFYASLMIGEPPGEDRLDELVDLVLGSDRQRVTARL